MVKELQRKFIKTTMLVVTILLVVFLASVNIINLTLIRQDNRSALDQIMAQNLPVMTGDIPDEGIGPAERGEERREDPGSDPPPAKESPGENLGESPGGGPGMARQSLGRYFTACISSSGDVTFSDLSHDADIDSDEMMALINGVDVSFDTKTSGGTKAEKLGSIGDYQYIAIGNRDGSVSYAFLNISRERESMTRIFLITIALGVMLWILILLLVMRLSKRAIAPIAENIDRQRRFITNAGHELKTPLAVIISNVDVQELHGGKTKWLDNIRSQALRLSDLTKQMLTLSKMEESGTAAFTSTTFDASKVLEDTVRVFSESALLRGIDVRTQIERGVLVHLPKEQYQQMLELLLDNAVKYGKENGFLSVTLHADRKMVRLSFQNDCDVLPGTDPNQLFDRFYRSDDSRSRQSGGSGIGLAVVRAIAQQNGGSAQAHFLPDQVIEFEIELQRGKM